MKTSSPRYRPLRSAPLRRQFYIAQPSYDWSPTYNAAPSQMLPIIRTYGPGRIELAR
jgi:putative SOS response-associated peptidase YedK